MKRRSFLKSAGGIAIAFSWSMPTVLAQQARPALPGSLGTNRLLNGWIRINPAGTVTVFTGKCELGQGILTALAQIAAEELDVAYERVEMVTPTPNNPIGVKGIGESGTVGSTQAVLNAVIDALAPHGVRHVDLPCNGENVWKALREARA